MRDAHTEELATIPEDMQDIYHAFVAETGDLLQAAGTDILRLEATGDMDLVAALFRGMHTIKGGAGFLNLRTLAAVAHGAEDILADVRDGRRELTAELIETLLSAVREIENILGLGVEGRTNAADYVRIQATTLDRLLELSGELIVRRNQLDSSVHRNADTETASNLETLRSLVQQMQGMVLAARMQPIAAVWGELPRAVRDLAGSLGKEVTLRLEGDDTELDRGLIEPLREVLLHLVRNALDHGIEDSTVREAAGKSPAGVLRIAAQPSAGEVLITVEDDGRGINLETIRRLSVERGILTGPEAAQVSDTGLLDIIFQPGFSTRSSVSATSGRGVGMDVVRSSVEQIGGKVSIITEAGRGTSITMRLPTTLVGVPVLVVRVGELLYGITRSCVLGILDERSWGMVAGSRVVRFNEEVLPTVNIGRAMGVPTASEGKAAIVCEVEGNRGAFVVDAAVDYTELVVKKLDPLLNPAGIYSGGGVLGDGKLVLLLDVQGFLKKHGPELRAVPDAMDPVAVVDAPVDTATNVLLCRGESGLMAIDTVKVERVVGLSEVESRVLRYGVMEFESSLLQVVDTLGNPLSSLEGFAALILLAASNARTKTAVAVREVIDIERLPIESVDDSIENQAGDTIISTTWGPVALLPQLNAIVGEAVT